jgi:hypothetical protein
MGFANLGCQNPYTPKRDAIVGFIPQYPCLFSTYSVQTNCYGPQPLLEHRLGNTSAGQLFIVHASFVDLGVKEATMELPIPAQGLFGFKT